ncbi:MAG: hypothetical protein OEY88_08875 [Candidatus Bathyarchaeota archaeon]|nr:hypothetical protein [Candidatus Bathyarchaeota archaeon]
MGRRRRVGINGGNDQPNGDDDGRRGRRRPTVNGQPVIGFLMDG